MNNLPIFQKKKNGIIIEPLQKFGVEYMPFLGTEG